MDDSALGSCCKGRFTFLERLEAFKRDLKLVRSRERRGIIVDCHVE